MAKPALFGRGMDKSGGTYMNTVMVSLEDKHFEILKRLSEAWGKDPEYILKFVCEKALITAAKNLEKMC